MRTVGQVLKETREEKKYTLEDVEKHTKIRVELLQALEADDYAKLPPATFIQGFIKNYGKFLTLDENKLLAIFRRDYEARKHPPVVLDSFANPIPKTKFRITPSKIIGVTIAVVIISFFAYLWLEYRQFVEEPTLNLASPIEGQTVDIPQVIIEGKTDPESIVKVNEGEIGVDQSGNFKEEIKLSSSTNKVIITATNKFGKSKTLERNVFVKQ